MRSLADKLISFYGSIKPPTVPKGVEVLFPQQDPQVMELVKLFFNKYFNDTKKRNLMLGINPGRFGAGITGVNFTAPKQLKENCGIDHHIKSSSELSAEFMYEMINEYGGVKKFYQRWFIGSVCPLGFVTKPTPRSGKEKKNRLSPLNEVDDTFQVGRTYGTNINYYDDKQLQEAVTPFIIECINKQMDIGFSKEKCLCIGGEKNYKFLKRLNDEYKWFDEIIPLPHPRFILQYRRKQKDKYIHQYLSAMRFAG
jgi:hypothetical protein